MTNRALEAFLEISNDTDFAPKAKESDDFFENLLKDEVTPFLKAAKEFFKKGKLDFATLGVEDEAAALNVKRKGGALKKQNEILKESSSENVEENVNVNSVQVKKEKVSTILDKENDTITKIEMPAPDWIPPKKKVKEIKTERPSLNKSSRTTRTKGGKAPKRESDVIIQNPEIPMIDLSDNENGYTVQTRSGRTKKKTQVEDSNTDAATTRSTRTKTRNQKTENANEIMEIETRSTRTKTLKKGKKDEEVPNEEPEIEPRSTRTKTIRKKKDVSEDEAKNSESDDNQMSTRNAKGKTIKKGKGASEDEAKNNEAEESQMSTRSARTKTMKKANKVYASGDSDTEPTRSTRTKTIRKQTNAENLADVPKPGYKGAVSKAKRSRSGEDDDDDLEERQKSGKKSKSNSPPVNVTIQSVYEDARSSMDKEKVNEKPLNSTYIAPNSELKPVPPLKPIEAAPSTIANATMVVSEPSYNIFQKKSDNNLFTDDESLELPKSPQKVVPMSTKEVFSPYAKSSIKKKVEAFEKLQKANEIPHKLSGIPRSARDTPMKDKLRLQNTPLSKFMPTSCSTSKVSRFLGSQQLLSSRSSSNDSLLSTKSAQKDPRERQRKLLEREQALKKKEAMLLAQAEAKRKQNEEKQLKAQQQRKLIEAEKLKLLELQKQKEDRQKQRELEREEYTQKQKLELEKKRAAQKKKIQELQDQRKAEQEAKEAQDQQQRKPEPPIYMTTPAPRLPTDECYDSDDPEHHYTSKVVVSWAQSKAIKMTELGILAAGEKIKNTFYCIHAQTIDLADIFQNIDRRKLQRNSSRLWKKAPRYTMMPDLNETKFSEDEWEDDLDT